MLDTDLAAIVFLSLRVSALALIISAAIGIPAGAWLGRAQFRGKSLVTALVHAGHDLRIKRAWRSCGGARG